jgi:aminoglycoside 3-N-acetyltransferase
MTDKERKRFQIEPRGPGRKPVISLKDIQQALTKLRIDRQRPVIVHASLSAFGYVQGGAETVVQALLAVFDSVVMPTFTYKTMLVPETGPANNGLTYGSRADANRMAEFYRPDMPVDRLMGLVPEALRKHPQAQRSMHPIQSFAGINAQAILASQTILSPLAPIGKLVEMEGWVLLMGVNHTVNTSIHYAEKLAGRKQFIRWALTPAGVVECPGFPGCSDGFEAIAPRLEKAVRRTKAGPTNIQAIPLAVLMETVQRLIAADPLALLCEHSYCERCATVRRQAKKDPAGLGNL